MKWVAVLNCAVAFEVGDRSFLYLEIMALSSKELAALLSYV